MKTAEAHERSPAAVASPDAGARFQFTISVDDVDATRADLAGRGVELLNGPMDRPWGIRTAAFRDPAGHIWEVASVAAWMPRSLVEELLPVRRHPAVRAWTGCSIG